MAWMIVQPEGSKLGPCAPSKGGNGVVLYCGHIDCRQNRDAARSVCLPCGRQIGYEQPYVGEPGNYQHHGCACAAAEARG